MKASVTWDDYRWVAVPDVGGVTQAKRLDQIPDRVVEVVKLITGDIIAASDVVLDVDWPGAEEAAALRAERAELETRDRQLVADTDDVVRRLRDSGLSLRDVATLTGVSHQRAHQLVQAAKRTPPGRTVAASAVQNDAERS